MRLLSSATVLGLAQRQLLGVFAALGRDWSGQHLLQALWARMGTAALVVGQKHLACCLYWQSKLCGHVIKQGIDQVFGC